MDEHNSAGQEPDLVLSAVLDLRAAAPLAADLAARRGRDVRLQATDVRKLGGQCLQVLLAAQASWRAEGALFRVVEPSVDFVESLELLGAAHLVAEAGVGE